MSNKDTKKNFVGQPVFKQMLDFIPKEKFDLLALEHQTDRYYKAFPSYTQLVTMLFGIFSRCDSMNEVCSGMASLQGKLNLLGLPVAPAKSTAGDGLRERSNEFFMDVYFMLLEHYHPLLSVSRIDKVSFSKLFIFDSTTIRLFSEVMKGVGRKPKNEGKKKGGLKVHMMIDAHADTPVFVKISEAKAHDKKFMGHLRLQPFSMIVFDRAYNDYAQYAKWTGENIWFVGRLKKNAVYQVLKETKVQEVEKGTAGVLKVEEIIIQYGNGHENLCLKKVSYKDEKERHYEFITNNYSITPEEVAHLYKKRWNIETLFKKLKQNFQLHYFYSETENGIKTQIWCTLIAQLLMMVLKVKTATKKAFSTVAALVRINLIGHLDIFWLVNISMRSYTKRQKRSKNTGCQMQILFNRGEVGSGPP